MSHAKQSARPKRRSRAAKAVPLLGAAGLSLSLASPVSAATGSPAEAPAARSTAVSQVLYEEEISDVSLGTFYVTDKENAPTPRPRTRMAVSCAGCGGCGCGCGGCWTGQYLTPLIGGDPPPPPPPRRVVRPAHRHIHGSKNP